MNMCTFTWLRPVGIRMVDGGRADVQGSREDGGVAGVHIACNFFVHTDLCVGRHEKI